MVINCFFFSKDFEETCTMHTKIYNIEIIMGSETDEIIKKLLQSLLPRCRERLEESMKGSDFFIVLIYCITNFRK